MFSQGFQLRIHMISECSAPVPGKEQASFRREAGGFRAPNGNKSREADFRGLIRRWFGRSLL
ncbi:MAG TPA: hypothetical protein VE267_12420, partial [Bradyrhizobium sp.]|nr:hypothetical protein [Bradyrhizobium sp.]